MASRENKYLFFGRLITMATIIVFHTSLGVSFLFFVLGYVAQRNVQSKFATILEASDRFLRQSASLCALFALRHSTYLFRHSHRKTTLLLQKTRQYMSDTLEQSRDHVSNGIRGRRTLIRGKAPSPFFETLHRDDTGAE